MKDCLKCIIIIFSHVCLPPGDSNLFSLLNAYNGYDFFMDYYGLNPMFQWQRKLPLEKRDRRRGTEDRSGGAVPGGRLEKQTGRSEEYLNSQTL